MNHAVGKRRVFLGFIMISCSASYALRVNASQLFFYLITSCFNRFSLWKIPNFIISNLFYQFVIRCDDCSRKAFLFFWVVVKSLDEWRSFIVDRQYAVFLSYCFSSVALYIAPIRCLKKSFFLPSNNSVCDVVQDFVWMRFLLCLKYFIFTDLLCFFTIFITFILNDFYIFHIHLAYLFLCCYLIFLLLERHHFLRDRKPFFLDCCCFLDRSDLFKTSVVGSRYTEPIV